MTKISIVFVSPAPGPAEAEASRARRACGGRSPAFSRKPLRILAYGVALLALGAMPARAAALPQAAAAQSAPQAPAMLHGTVLDSTGAAVAGAQVELHSSAGTERATTGDQGDFSISTPAAAGTLLVIAPGFAQVSMPLDPRELPQNLLIKLTPSSNVERVQVTAAGDDRVPAVPASEYDVPADQIQASGGVTIDEVLRQEPGFSLFRRGGSLFANPTTLGVSMRGIGASGASRSNVLLDGIPLNDPFGRWVFWDEVPRVSIASVDVLNGAASDVYGGGALGGVVNIQSRQPRETFGELEASYGTLATPDLSWDGGLVLGKWAILIDGQAMRTGGYVLIPSSERGPVDVPAGARSVVGSAQVSRTFGERGMFFVRTTTFAESRANGTPLTKNNTRIPSGALGADWAPGHWGSFSGRVYGQTENYFQTFSSVLNAARTTETLSDTQTSPSHDVGFEGQWQRTFQGRQTVTAGVEGQFVTGQSSDTSATTRTVAGGTQSLMGYFAQDAVQLPASWLLTFGGRVDTWLNGAGFQDKTTLSTGALVPTAFPNRAKSSFDPRISLLHNFRHNIAVSATAYHAFRPPTLNELYRSYRLSNTQTNANASLDGERLIGGEATVSAREFRDRVTLRGTFFWSEIADLIANIPTGMSGTTFIDTRENLGNTRARGAEIALDVLVLRRMQVSASYVYTDSTTVTGTPPARIWVPQVSKDEVNVQWSYIAPRWDAGVQVRYLSSPLDDLSFLPLGSAFTVDAELSRQVVPHASVFAAAQNLFGDRYAISRTLVSGAPPLTNIGPPAMARGGFRLTWN